MLYNTFCQHSSPWASRPASYGYCLSDLPYYIMQAILILLPVPTFGIQLMSQAMSAC